MKLVIFTVVLNEAGTITELIERLPKKIPGIETIETVVLSDGSTDDTVKFARKAGATEVIEGKQQKRLAYRFNQALDLVLSRGADIAVNIDGDLQFRPEDIPLLVQPIIAGEADFVAADRFTDTETGERRKPKNMSTGKYYANRVGSYIVGRLSGYGFRDVTCGFRAYNREAMLALNINSPYTYTQESFQILALKNMNIKALPVVVTYYPGRKSRVVTNFFQFLINSALNIMRAFRDFEPLKFFFYLGLLPFLFGGAASAFVGLHWLDTRMTSPYTSLGILGVYLFSVGILIWVVGLVADMLDRVNKNQEKLITLAKKNLYDKDRD